jgi:4-amino-4-deoxy-L-arabinose transferase-like glycosyltransferase
MAVNAHYYTTLFFKYLLHRATFVWGIFLLLTMAWGLCNLRGEWQGARGWEQQLVAQSIAGSHGFSFDASHRWMFVDFRSAYSSDEYFPTAMVEPVYPTLMAIFFKALGDYGKLAILVFQVIALLITCVFIYHLGRMLFNSWTGMLAGSILAILPAAQYEARGTLQNAIFAGLIVSIAACVIIWCLEKVSVRRGITLGFVLGFTCLTLVSTLLFIPIAVLLVLLSARPFRPVVWKTALSILLTAFVVVSPWTVRNLLVFGEFIPVRTGLGLNSYIFNPILAATFSPGFHACSDTLGPLWKAPDARKAILLARKSSEKRQAMYKRSFDCIEHDAPEGYERFNEAKRDKVYLKKALDFILSEPGTFIMMAYHKGLAFFSDWGIDKRVVALLALIGALITLRNHRARVLTLLALAYAVPYSLASPLFYRYRYPIEPILLLLASHVLILAASTSNKLWHFRDEKLIWKKINRTLI